MYKQAKIPTLLGLALLLLGVGVGVLLIQKGGTFNLSASPTQIPKEVRITNITDKSFSVSWITDKPTNGFISYGKDKAVGTVVNQDTAQGQNSYVHQATASHLAPSTTYSFKIGFGDAGINKSKLYSVKTAPSLQGMPESDVIFGTVVNANNAPVAGSVVYLTVPGITPLSTNTDSQGKWTLPLSTTRSTDLAKYATYDRQETLLEIFVQAGNEKFASAKIKTGAAHPVPPLQLGQTHDFTNLKPVSDGKAPSSELNLTSIQLPSPSPSSSPNSGFSRSLAQARSSSSPSPKASPTSLPISGSPSPASQATGSGSASPTPKPSPNPSPSASPKAVVAPGLTTSSSARNTLPSAGNLTATMFVFIIGMVLVVVGLFVPQNT